MIKRKRRVLSEASQLKQAYQKLEKGLKEELNLSDTEITYAIEFYKEVRRLDLFNTNYFKNFEYEGELFDIKNIQKFAKYPEAFHDIVMIVFHNPAFLDYYHVSFNGVNVKLDKITAETEAEETLERQATTPYDNYKVAEDSNYYTFFVPNHNIGSELRTFFGDIYPDDKRITESNEFYPTWCIISSSGSSHFNDEKFVDTDVWLVTYTKKNPADLKNQNRDKYASLKGLKDAKFGEVYMMDKDGTIKGRNKNRGKSNNYGYHRFSNDPYYGKETTALEPRPAYSYSQIDLDNPIFYKDFTIEAGVLTKCYVDDEVIRVPQGVTEIAEGAFKNLQVKEVILPPSTRIIRSGAFDNTRQLYAIRATNNLEVIETNAFAESMSKAYEILISNAYDPDMFNDESTEDIVDYIKRGIFFIFGVFDTSGGKLSISKPSKLRYMPKVLSRATKMLQDKLSGDTQEESKRKSVKESFRVKRANYEQTDLYSIEGSRLVVDAMPSESKEVVDLDLSNAPEVKEVVLNLRKLKFPNLKTIKFPKGVEDISKVNFSGSRKIKEIDLSETSIKEIPNRAFAKMPRLRRVKLPETVQIIEALAFESSGIGSLEVSDTTKVHPTAFKNAPFMKEIIVNDRHAFKNAQDEGTVERLERQKIKILEKQK